MGTPDPRDSVAATLADGDRVERLARWSVEDVLRDLFLHADRPTRYSDDAALRRAERDIDGDLAGDVRLYGGHSEAEAGEWRRRYRVAYLAAWRDPALWRHVQTSTRVFVVHVCYR